ncbi:DUF885 family protein [Streptosporangium sandarakinum]
MPKRTDIRSVMVIGSGPIVIGQACEFDYSGTQACRVLRAEGFRVILVNSNPATIMTDPEFADATYVEPITPEIVEKIIAKERPDALLPTLGGQTALNTAIALHEAGVLKEYGVELIGADVDAIQAGENREMFKAIVAKVAAERGLNAESARSVVCHTMDECLAGAAELGYPLVVRPSFTMGGVGSGFAHDEDGLRRIAGAGLDAGMHLRLEIPAGTGFHEGERWTPELGAEFLRTRTLTDPARAADEIDRYLGWPGQASAYKLGERLWLDLREEARAGRGAEFDLKDFHTRALRSGPAGLDIMRELLTNP